MKLFQQFSQFIFKCFTPQATGNDLSLGIDQQVERDGTDHVHFCHLVVPEFQVGNMGPGKLVLFDGFQQISESLIFGLVLFLTLELNNS